MSSGWEGANEANENSRHWRNEAQMTRIEKLLEEIRDALRGVSERPTPGMEKK
jgi:hypothetical protein